MAGTWGASNVVLYVLEGERFDREYVAAEARHGWTRPWIERFFRRLPDAYDEDFCRFHPSGPGLADGPGTVCRKGKEGDEGLMAHEHGHHLGFQHPSPWSPMAYLDVMGPVSLRIFDVHGLRPLYRAWRATAMVVVDPPEPPVPAEAAGSSVPSAAD